MIKTPRKVAITPRKVAITREKSPEPREKWSKPREKSPKPEKSRQNPRKAARTPRKRHWSTSIPWQFYVVFFRKNRNSSKQRRIWFFFSLKMTTHEIWLQKSSQQKWQEDWRCHAENFGRKSGWKIPLHCWISYKSGHDKKKKRLKFFLSETIRWKISLAWKTRKKSRKFLNGKTCPLFSRDQTLGHLNHFKLNKKATGFALNEKQFQLINQSINRPKARMIFLIFSITQSINQSSGILLQLINQSTLRRLTEISRWKIPYLFFSNRQRIPRVQILFPVKHRFLAVENGMRIALHHGLDDVAVHASRALIRLDGDVVVVDETARHVQLEMIRTQHDDPSFSSDVWPPRTGKLHRNTGHQRHRRHQLASRLADAASALRRHGRLCHQRGHSGRGSLRSGGSQAQTLNRRHSDRARGHSHRLLLRGARGHGWAAQGARWRSDRAQSRARRCEKGLKIKFRHDGRLVGHQLGGPVELRVHGGVITQLKSQSINQSTDQRGSNGSAHFQDSTKSF